MSLIRIGILHDIKYEIVCLHDLLRLSFLEPLSSLSFAIFWMLFILVFVVLIGLRIFRYFFLATLHEIQRWFKQRSSLTFDEVSAPLSDAKTKHRDGDGEQSHQQRVLNRD